LPAPLGVLSCYVYNNVFGFVLVLLAAPMIGTRLDRNQTDIKGLRSTCIGNSL